MLCTAAGVVLALSASASASTTVQSGLAPIERILPYYDEDYDFEVAVPENWTRIFAALDDQGTDELEPGYAVGFESPRSNSDDVFADYLMVEILPGSQTGAFTTDGTHSDVVIVDGRAALTDHVYLDGFDINGNSIDLVVFQAEIVELGFTIGIYAIGEKREAAVLADAFQLALKTFKVPIDPFRVI